MLQSFSAAAAVLHSELGAVTGTQHHRLMVKAAFQQQLPPVNSIQRTNKKQLLTTSIKAKKEIMF